MVVAAAAAVVTAADAVTVTAVSAEVLATGHNGY